jgi:hypothetical protein
MLQVFDLLKDFRPFIGLALAYPILQQGGHIHQCAANLFEKAIENLVLGKEDL